MPIDDSWDELAQPSQANHTVEWVHSTGVHVYVAEENGKYYSRIENPTNSSVDRISIGPDIPVPGSPFDSAAAAEQATNQWILSADMSILAPADD